MNKPSAWTAQAAAFALMTALNAAPVRAEDAPKKEPAAAASATDPDFKPGDEPLTSAERSSLLQIGKSDVALGDPKAPVVMIEYASMSCSHCAAFHKETFGRLKKDYIDTGKVYFALRDFPLNKAAVTGATLTRCAPKEKFYSFVSALFSSQDQWVTPEIEQQLEGIARIGGMSKDTFKACMKDEKLTNSILESRFNGSKILSIRSTPTFFVNGIQYEGGKDYEFFAGVLDKLIKEKGGVPPVHSKPEEPKAEDKKAEEPKAEEKKAEEPKAEDKKAEEPKAEDKKAEEPKAEEKKAEEPKAEEKKAEEPKAEEKKAEEPKAEDKKAEEPKAEEKKAEEPKAEEKKAEEKAKP